MSISMDEAKAIDQEQREERERTAPPNPGSDEALDLGCSCPVLDNAHGEGLQYPDGPVFWVNRDCPLHGDCERDAT